MKKYFKYLILIIVVIIVVIILVFIFKNYNSYFGQKDQKTIVPIIAKTINSPKSLSILKPDNFLLVNSYGVVRDEIIISPSNFQQQLYSYLSNNTPKLVLSEYKNYFKNDGWIVEKINKIQDDFWEIKAEKNGLDLELKILPDKMSNKRTLVNLIFTEKTKKYNFDPKNNLANDFKDINFYYALPNINFIYKKNLEGNLNEIKAQYESYTDRDNLYDLYYNKMKEKGWDVENIKTDVFSKKVLKASKLNNYFFIDIDNIIVSKEIPSKTKTMVTIYYFYK